MTGSRQEGSVDTCLQGVHRGAAAVGVDSPLTGHCLKTGGKTSGTDSKPEDLPDLQRPTREHGSGEMYMSVRIALLLVGLLSATATADLMIDESEGLMLDVSYWSGSGSQTSYLVLDFEPTGGEQYAFGFRWDDEATVLDMFEAFMQDNLLEIAMTTYDGFGTFVDNFTYGDETGDTSFYWGHSFASPDGSGDVPWTAANNGVDVETLSDGLISGWYNGFTDEFDVIPPSLPLVTVPAPAALALLGIAGLSRRRRR